METTNSNQLFHPENDGMIYQNSPDNKARFVLGTRGNNPLIVMSINPSVGAPDVKSPTVGTVEHIAKDYGYDSWIILCLYPQRATHLDELDEMTNPNWVKENEKVIREVFAYYPDHKIWATWGTHYKHRYYFPELLSSIAKIAEEYHESWMHYGPLDEGYLPQYCLYLDNGEGWYPYDVNKLLSQSF